MTKTKIIIFLLGLISGVASLYLVNSVRHRAHASETEFNYQDNNGDGTNDVMFIFTNGHLTEIRTDRDFDGIADWMDFIEKGAVTHSRGDNNGDGINDVWCRYLYGIVSEERVDTDGNGVPDMLSLFTNGVLRKRIWNKDSTSVVMKTEYFISGIKHRERMYTTPTNSIVTVYDAYGVPVRKYNVRADESDP